MPVADRPSHPSTVVGTEFRYGCNTTHPEYKKRKPGYWAPDRVYVGDRYFERHTWIEDTSSTTCIFPLDAACEGCEKALRGESTDV